jgi:hypothetical protein
MQEKGLRPLASAVIIALLAAVLRFYDLGAWPYSGDETASLHEEDVLFHGAQVSHDSQAYRLPHLIPTSYLALHISHALFGRDEWGTRVVVALLGTAASETMSYHTGAIPVPGNPTSAEKAVGGSKLHIKVQETPNRDATVRPILENHVVTKRPREIWVPRPQRILWRRSIQTAGRQPKNMKAIVYKCYPLE